MVEAMGAKEKDQTGPEHLEIRARRFLKGYLSSEDAGKLQYYKAVEDISRKCQPALSFAQPASDDIRIAEATSVAAMKMVLQLNEGLTKTDQPDFFTDACATVAIAYHWAAGVYVNDENMQELGTAAVHLLTMATSYASAQRDVRGSDQRALPFEDFDPCFPLNEIWEFPDRNPQPQVPSVDAATNTKTPESHDRAGPRGLYPFAQRAFFDAVGGDELVLDLQLPTSVRKMVELCDQPCNGLWRINF